MPSQDSILDAAVATDATTLAIRRALFRSLLSGEPVDHHTAARSTGLDESVVRETVVQLVGAGVATLANEGQDLLIDGSEGLTTRPTRHSLLIEGHPLHTWCAFDIVGIPAALGISTSGSTDCPTCGRTIELTLSEGKVDDNGAVGWWPTATGGPVIEAFCPSASIFCSPEHLEEWRIAKGASGSVKTLGELEDLGRTTWMSLVE